MGVLLISSRRIKTLEQQIQELREQVEQIQKVQCAYCTYKEKEGREQQIDTDETAVLQEKYHLYEMETSNAVREQIGIDTEITIINEVLSEVFPV